MDHYYALLFDLEKYDKQEDVFINLISLLNNDIKKLGKLNEVIVLISAFINMNQYTLGKPGSWSYHKYIEEIYNKLLEFKILKQTENYDSVSKRAVFNILIDYIDFNLGLQRLVSDTFLIKQ